MDKSVIFGFGIAIVFGLLPFAIKDIPQEACWIGIAFGIYMAVWGIIPASPKLTGPLGLLIFGFICILTGGVWWGYAKTAPIPSVINPTASPRMPEVILLPASGQLNLENRGKEDIYLWGNKFDNDKKDLFDEPRTIPVRGFYYFLTDKLERLAPSMIGPSGEKLFSYEIYLTDSVNNHYIAKFKLLIKVQNEKVTIHTQQLGIKQEKW